MESRDKPGKRSEPRRELSRLVTASTVSIHSSEVTTFSCPILHHDFKRGYLLDFQMGMMYFFDDSLAE